jgi:hypothetical protein
MQNKSLIQQKNTLSYSREDQEEEKKLFNKTEMKTNKTLKKT